MTNCSVPGCKENGYHLFPKDKNTKRLWAKAIKRPELAKRQSSCLRICGRHFTENDYKTVKSTTGFKLQRRILKKNVIPSVFPWSEVPPLYAAAREERLRNRNLKRELFTSNFGASDSGIKDCETSNLNEQQGKSYNNDTKIQNIDNKFNLDKPPFY